MAHVVVNPTLPSADQASDVLRRFEQRRVEAELRARLFGAEVAKVHVDRFEVRRRLGEGAMGIAYAAYDPQLQREVALKLLHVRDHAEAQAALQEARALARVAHEGVLTVHEAGLHDGIAYIVSELVGGGTLRQWLAADVARRAPDVVVPLLVAIAEGVAAAHRRGVAHRDLKPENVLVGTDGRPRVADFGLAITAPLAPGTSATGLPLAGTVGYMAPEQLRGERADPLSDQFAFGVMGFEALFGRLPFEASTPSDLLRAIEAGAVAEVPGVHPARRFLPVLRRALATDPAARWPSMEALAVALRGARRSRRRAIAAGVAAGLVAVGAALGALAWQDAEDRGHVDHAIALTQQQRFDACADYLAEHARTDGMVQMWIGCAEAATDPRKLVRACAAFPKRSAQPLPFVCSAFMAKARALRAAGRNQECFDTILAGPPSSQAMSTLAACMRALPSDAARARRMCVYMESLKPPKERTTNCQAGVKSIE